MPITPDRISRLREFGLSEYAARAYLALLDLGLTEARDVSNLSRVPQAKVYQVLDQLHDKGLAIILPEFPKKYAPVPFEEFLDRIHRQHLDAAGTIQKTRKELTTLFSVTGNVDVGDRGDFTVVRGRRNVLERIVEVFGKAQQDLLVLGTPGLASRPQFLADKTAAAVENGARVRFLLPIDEENVEALQRLAERSPVRAREAVAESASDNVAIVIADGRQALLIHFVPDDGDLTNGRDVAVYTDQEAMVGAIQAMTGPLWEHATTFAARREQMETGRQPTFTHLYTSPQQIREAIGAAAARKPRELRALNPDTSGIPVEHSLDVVPRITSAGGRVRAILARLDAESTDRFQRVTAAAPSVEARHLDPPAPTHFWLFDEAEALVIFGPPGTQGALALHTNSPSVLKALRVQFEELWTRAVAFPEALQERARYPDLHPREAGIGRLFAAMAEAVVIVSEEGTVRAWNPAAERLLGHAPGEACGRHVSELFPETSPDALRALLARGEGTFAEPARHRDGSRVHVEATLGALPHEALRFLVLRQAAARDARPVPVQAEPEEARVRPERR
jgi:PAS domain S-box-containing protein